MDGRTDDQRLLQQDSALADLAAALDAERERAAEAADTASDEAHQARERERVLQNEVWRLDSELRRAREELATGRNMERYLDWIGREHGSGDYQCDLEKHWPYGPRRDYQHMIECGDLADPKTWSWQSSHLFEKSAEELVAYIRAGIADAMYYLCVLAPRHHGFQFGDQHKEAVRMFEFLCAPQYGLRPANPPLDCLDEAQLRAVALIVDMSFENLC